MAHKTMVNGTNYEIGGGKTLVGGAAYSIDKGKTLVGGTAHEIGFSPYDAVFANNTWELIIQACQNNEVPETWTVGSQKAMTIDGKEYLVDIIGKNHDDYYDSSGKAPLTFQTHTACPNNQSYEMYPDSVLWSGWGSSMIKTSYLPSLLRKFPSEVQSAIKNIKKLTSRYGGSSAIETSSNKLFLLSEVELWGTTYFSKAGEGTHYEYYANGGSVNKQCPPNEYNQKIWWLRSPRDQGMYCSVFDDNEWTCSAIYGYCYLVPAFCF